MVNQVVVLSGPICSGKSALGQILAERYGAVLFKTNQLILTLRPELAADRKALQEAGEALDRTTKGRWVADALVREAAHLPTESIIIVDAVRIKEQIDALREAYGRTVIHIHLTAADVELARRYRSRSAKFAEFGTYQQVRQSATERAIESIAEFADVIIESDRCRLDDVLVRAAARLNLYPRTVVPLVDVIVGGQYGSEGKGNIVSYIAPEYAYLVRVGGPNAGHKVYGEPPYTFHHLPSGTLSSERAKLIIGPGAVIAVDKLMTEVSDCGVTHDRLLIDEQAVVIEPRDVNREKKRLGPISSTAQGVGEATARRINDRGFYVRGRGVKLARDIPVLKPFVGRASEVLERAYLANSRILLEGTQGTSLSLYHGFYPHVTSRDTTVSGCLAEAGISPRRVRKVIMVCRTYPIRVGGPSGPMSQEISKAEIARRSGLSARLLGRVERTSTTGRPRRFGEFDWEQLRRSTILNGPTDIALSFADYLNKDNKKARRFEQLDKSTIQFIEEVERVSGTPVSLISTRFHYRCIVDRRSW